MSEKIIISCQTETKVYGSISYLCAHPSLNDYVHNLKSKSNGSKNIILETSKIPQGATIESINFIKNPIHAGNHGGSDSCYIEDEKDGSISLQTEANSTILKWLNEHQYNDGTYPNLTLKVVLSISSSVPSHTHASLYGSTTVSGSRSSTYNSNNTYLEITYIPPIDPTQPSPKIINFILKDTFKLESKSESEIDYQKMAYLNEVSGKVNENGGGKTSKEAEIGINCFYQNYSNLEFSVAEAISYQPNASITYELKIVKSISDLPVVYEKTSNESSSFLIPKNIFSSENFSDALPYIDGNGTVIFNFLPYTFYYTVYDSFNNGTRITGTIFLIKDYFPPDVSQLLVERFEIVPVIENDNIIYKEQITPNGEFLTTTLSCKISKIPYIILEDNAFDYNFLSYRIKWVNNDTGEEGEIPYSLNKENPNWITIEEESLSFLNDNNLLSGEKINNSYENSYSATNSFTITFSVKDVCTIITRSFIVQPAFSYLNIELNGISIGERHSSGTEKNPTFDINLPTTVKKDISFEKSIATKSLIFLKDGITYGEEEPSNVFQDAIEGQIYFRLL